ncbi:MalY/PatB family protein [Salinibius halmophilus]|uniref:MalY/PatB family protein n=1 Tax=Salinibius halmophilus TaxID=1853216 RepID=UPI0013140CDA|nr:aminotransferase class I/II-fold pyridoxal phosphate-dependent enzyme [Salinibius halmophilus]
MIELLSQRPNAMKWQKYSADILPLWVADMDFAPAQVIQQAIAEASQDLGYQLPPEWADEQVVRWLASEHNCHIEPSWVVWQGGVISGFNTALASVCQSGDEVVVPTPTYPPMRQAPVNHGARCVEMPLEYIDGIWQLNLDKLANQLARPQCKAMLISNPMNPTGCVYQQIGEISKLCHQHNVLLVSDEIHADLVLAGKAHDSALHYNTDHLVVLMAASKTFNIAGLATSYMICPNAKLRKRVQKAGAGIAGHANVLGVMATATAYQAAKPWLNEVKTLLTNNLSVLNRWQETQDSLISYPVNATYLAWMDWRQLTDTPYPHLLSYGIALSDGAPFGAPGWARLNFACSSDTLSQALQRMQQAIEAL